MKKLIIRNMVVLLLFALTGCGKCEHEYDNGMITKESTCTEEGEKTYTCIRCEEVKLESVPVKAHTYTEKITKEATFEEEGEKIATCEYCGDSYMVTVPILEMDAYNRAIYDQMVEFCNNEKYMDALILGREADKNNVQSKKKIDEFAKEIMSSNWDYINEQMQYAFDNHDYEIMDTLYYFERGFSGENLEEYHFLNRVQGLYTDIQNANNKIEIAGYILKIGENEYVCDYDKKAPYQEDLNYLRPVLLFEAGTIEEEGTGVIKITYINGN